MFLFPPGRSLLFLSCIFYTGLSPVASWDTDLELFDLVEEIPQTFYQFLSVDKVGDMAALQPSGGHSKGFGLFYAVRRSRYSG